MSTELSRGFPESHYSWPDRAGRWVRANLIVGVDFLWAVDGVSGGLGNDSDHALFTYLRDTADAIVVGGGTARAEDYSGARRSGITGKVPALVVVGSSAEKFDPGSNLFTDVLIPTDVVVQRGSDTDAAHRLEKAGAAVHPVLGDDWAEDLCAWLETEGHRRILLEGGPGVFDTVARAGLIDECCVTRSPVRSREKNPRTYRPAWFGPVTRAWMDADGYVGEIRSVRRG